LTFYKKLAILLLLQPERAQKCFVRFELGCVVFIKKGVIGRFGAFLPVPTVTLSVLMKEHTFNLIPFLLRTGTKKTQKNAKN